MNSIKPRRTISVFALVMINIIAVDNLRSIPFSAAYGFSLLFYYLIASVCFFIPSSLVSAELATGWPNTGGIYIWVREAFGERFAFFIIWIQWVYNVVWYPTILTFIAVTFAYLIDPNLANDKRFMLILVLILFWIMTFINTFGMKISSFISTLGALLGTIFPMIAIIVLAYIWLLLGNPSQIVFSWSSVLPDLTHINNAVFFTAILYGLVGMEMSGTHAEEVKDPHTAYPKALLISSMIILFTLISASLAVAVIVPSKALQIEAGLIQAFQLFFNQLHLAWMLPILALFIILGGLSSVAAWIIGPTKGLLAATKDGNIPPYFCRTNIHGVPTTLLLTQGIIFTILCSAFILLPSVSSAYWLLTAMAVQLSLLVYIALFAAVIRLRYSQPNQHRAFKIPGGLVSVWMVGGLGILTCLATIGLGFLPPQQVAVGDIYRYETMLVCGIIILCSPPLVMVALRKPDWRR